MAAALTSVPDGTRPLRALLYARASRDPRHRGRSTDDQMAENRRECIDRGWTWTPETDEFTDTDRSASRHAKKARDHFEAMVAAVRAGRCDVVVAWESSRLQRDLEVYVMLRRVCLEAGVLWCYNGTVYDMSKRSDRRTTAMDAIQSEDESEGIRLRNLRTTRLNAERGGPHGRIPFGYAREYDSKTGELLAQVPDPVEAPIVREIFDRLAAGRSGYSIAEYLNGRGIKTRQGLDWRPETVIGMVRGKATYIGRRVHQGEIVGKALWDPIVEPAVYHAVQKIISAPARRTNRDTQVKHLLSGIAECGLDGCGNHMYILKNRGYLTYVCKPSPHVAIRETNLDAYVEEGVVEWLASPAALEAFRAADTTEQAAAALVELDRLNSELQEAQQLAKARKLSVGSLAALEAGLLPEIERWQRLARPAGLPPVVEHLVGAPDAEERWNALEDIEQKRAVLRAIVRVTVHRGRQGVRRIEPGRVTLAFLGSTADGV